jgi:hypothetical protein
MSVAYLQHHLDLVAKWLGYQLASNRAPLIQEGECVIDGGTLPITGTRQAELLDLKERHDWPVQSPFPVQTLDTLAV